MTARERNPERSRERIIDAAREEFAAHGYAGARVDAIATRAGLNKQLISHHFGGKRNLYRTVMGERRLRGELVGTAETMPTGLSAFFDRSTKDHEWVRLLLWEALDDEVEGDDATGIDERRDRFQTRVVWVEQEQAAGRLPAELDPALLLVSLLGSAIYPVLLPDVCELITGSRPDDEDFTQRYRTHLRDLATLLAPDAGRKVTAHEQK